MKNIYRSNKGYVVSKIRNGKTIYGGKYPSMSVAVKVRDALIEDDWDLSNLQNIRDELRKNGEVL